MCADVHDGKASGFRHEALFYAGEPELLAGLTSFVRDGLAAGEPTLVVLSAPKIERLKQRLGGYAGSVQFLEMNEVGLNPARIIPAWRDFVSEHSGAPGLRGIGEPIWADRSPSELVECHRHEALLNLAFDHEPRFWLQCPYDTQTLGPAALDGARRNHPFLSRSGYTWESPDYPTVDPATAWLDDPLPEPPGEVLEVVFQPGPLGHVRVLVAGYAEQAGLSRARAADIVLAVHEVATNSQRHGGGRGVLRVWHDERALTCEVRDGGRIEDPLAGRVRPSLDEPDGRGLWLVNHLCDLVQIRSVQGGTVVRLHMWR
jgi:anti-sigma regulatory factor (Ser/Thr protein kinase)